MNVIHRIPKIYAGMESKFGPFLSEKVGWLRPKLGAARFRPQRSSTAVQRDDLDTLDAKFLWKSSKHLYYACLFSPFVQKLASGTLPSSTFRQFVSDDHGYLKAFRSALCTVEEMVSTSPLDRNKAQALKKSRALVEAVDEELSRVHASHRRASDHGQPSWATASYIDFITRIEQDPESSIATVLASVLPCFRLYHELANRLDSANDHPYSQWIKYYASEQYRDAVLSAEWLFDEYAMLQWSEHGKDRCRWVYHSAMHKELAFFGAHAPVTTTIDRQSGECRVIIVEFDDVVNKDGRGTIDERRRFDTLQLALATGTHVIVFGSRPAQVIRSAFSRLKLPNKLFDYDNYEHVELSGPPAVHIFGGCRGIPSFSSPQTWNRAIVVGQSRSLSSMIIAAKAEGFWVSSLDEHPFSPFDQKGWSEHGHPRAYHATWDELHGLLLAMTWDPVEEEGIARNAMKTPILPKVLIISGSDSGGGAGLQGDVKTCERHGVYSSTAVTAVTIQNSVGVEGIHMIPGPVVRDQIRAVLTDIETSCIKIGMLGSVENVRAVGQVLRPMSGKHPIVLDPVLASSSGSPLAQDGLVEALKEELFPLSTVITPNLSEASTLLGNVCIDSLQSMRDAARELYALGPDNVLIKGGHWPTYDGRGKPIAVDIMFDGSMYTTFSRPYLSQRHNSHGTGCTLASAIASNLARGDPMPAAVLRAKQFVWHTLERSSGLDLGKGLQKPMNHSHEILEWARSQRTPNSIDVSLYAVTSPSTTSADKTDEEVLNVIKSVVSGGASVIQIRDKVSEGGRLVRLVSKIVRLCRPFGVNVIVNDRVDVCIASDACGVHVGQGDIPASVVRQMIGPEKILGVSCKTVRLAEKAQIDGADYVGCGAVFDTPTKDSARIGIQGVREIKQHVHIPVVAIGGLDVTNIERTLRGSQCDGVAVVRSIFDAPDTAASTATLRRLLNRIQADRRAP